MQNASSLIFIVIVVLTLGIELVSETTEQELQSAEGAAPDLVAGVKVAYTVPAPAAAQVSMLHGHD